MRSAKLESMAAVNFPEEILLEILVRLPPKSLVTSSAVCKLWRSLIRSSALICGHLRRAIIQSNKDHRVQFVKSWSREKETERYSLYWDGSSSFSEYSNFINPFITVNEIKRKSSSSTSSTTFVPNPGKPMALDKDYEETTVVGTCNGIVCLCASDFTTFLIWNPCLRKLVILPPPPSDTAVIDLKKRFYAFGYDKQRNDYKVLRSVGYSRNRKLLGKVEIWSLASGSWKSLSKEVVPANFPHGIRHPCERPTDYDPPYVHGAVHWLPFSMSDRDENFIVSFDVSSEVFGKTALPRADFGRFSSYSLIRHMESLAFFENHDNLGLIMWVMKEYGIAESWVKLLTVSPQEMLVTEPLAFRKNGELVVVLWDSDGCGAILHQSVDIKTKKSNDFWKAGHCIQFIESFIESIVLLDQPNAISC